MKDLSVDDVVRLTKDLPNLNLHKGQTGVIRSLWFTSQVSYEVEFTGLDERTRAVLLREQVACEGEDLIAGDGRDRHVVEGSAAGTW